MDYNHLVLLNNWNPIGDKILCSHFHLTLLQPLLHPATRWRLRLLSLLHFCAIRNKASFFMMTWRCIQLCTYLLVGSSFIWFPASCLLGNSLPSQVVGSPNSPINKFLMQSYYDRYTNLLDSDFEFFLAQEVAVRSCDVLPDNRNFVTRSSVLKRDLIGEGSHRHLSTLIKFETQQSESWSELSSYSCKFVIVERLPSGVFADPFELQRLVERGVFQDVAVFGDTNLELPSFLSNRSAVEIHLDVDPNILVEPADIYIELPLHARYQPLNESGYSTVEFGAPDMFVRCSAKKKLENHNCFFKLASNDTNGQYDAGIVWRIPSGKKAHSDLVFAITFIAAMLSTLAIVVTSLNYSNNRLGKDFKQS